MILCSRTRETELKWQRILAVLQAREGRTVEQVEVGKLEAGKAEVGKLGAGKAEVEKGEAGKSEPSFTNLQRSHVVFTDILGAVRPSEGSNSMSNTIHPISIKHSSSRKLLDTFPFPNTLAPLSIVLSDKKHQTK